jgi:hypothetical protein
MPSAISILISQSTTQKGHAIAIVQARGMLARIARSRTLRKHIDASSARTRRRITLHGHRNAQSGEGSKRELDRCTNSSQSNSRRESKLRSVTGVGKQTETNAAGQGVPGNEVVKL